MNVAEVLTELGKAPANARIYVETDSSSFDVDRVELDHDPDGTVVVYLVVT